MDHPASHGRDIAPSPWLKRWAPLIAPGASVLDLAAGGGRHSRYLRELGHPVTALDRDIAGLAGESDFETIAADLEAGAWPLAERRFGAIVVVNYLHRELFPLLIAALAPGGVLIYETFARGNERFGRPRNPDFLLAPSELLDRLRGHLAIVAFEQGEVVAPLPAVVQRICAVNNPADAAARRIL